MDRAFLMRQAIERKTAGDARPVADVFAEVQAEAAALRAAAEPGPDDVAVVLNRPDGKGGREVVHVMGDGREIVQ